MHIIFIILIGFLIGLVARWIGPGVQIHGFWITVLVGIAGSFVGGTLAKLMLVEFNGWVGTLVVASIGAIIVLWIWQRFRDRSPAS